MFSTGGLAVNAMSGQLSATATPRRNEALAFIIDRIVRTGTSPSADEIGEAMGVSRQRAQQFVQQLIDDGVVRRRPGSRSLIICDLTHCRRIIVETLHGLGLTVSEPMGEMQRPLSQSQLPLVPPFEHIPDPE